MKKGPRLRFSCFASLQGKKFAAVLLLLILHSPLFTLHSYAQFNTDRLLMTGRSALYYEDYVVAIQYFNQAVSAKPYLYEPWFLRGVAKYYLDDFAGAEADCSEAVSRNPYVANVYELRALTRIQQKKYDEAIADYAAGLKQDPENRNFWHNRVYCRIRQKEYEAALADIDTMLTRWRNNAATYAMQAEVYLAKGDTVQADSSLVKSAELDPYDGQTWMMRAAIHLSKAEWKEGEGYLDKAIHLLPKQAGNYINRALARFNQNNLRGAMADYDTALDLDPNNFLGHYNRGLLRAQLGDDNRAITDFDFVLRLEPNNLMALFNRALLLDKTGDLRAAIRDYTKVIDQYPNFWTGLQQRASCYRRLGMAKKAEADEFRVYKAQLYKSLYGKQPRLNKQQMRKWSDVDMDKYNQLAVADEQEDGAKYASAYRGRVQNRKAEMELRPMYGLTYERTHNEVRQYEPFDLAVDSLNSRLSARQHVYVGCEQQPLDEVQSRRNFARLDSLTTLLGAAKDDKSIAPLLLQRAVAYSVIQNFEGAKDDLDAYIELDSTSALAYWQRGVCQERMNAYEAAQGKDVAVKRALVADDLAKALALHGQSPCILYNVGNAHASMKEYAKAIDYYTRAIGKDSNLAEAYFNRGLCRIFQNDAKAATTDLSKAGELGIYEAYSIIKKYSAKN